jgi:uncharacterized delta-60 repeat protein
MRPVRISPLKPFSFFPVRQPDANRAATPRRRRARLKLRTSTRGRFEELESRRVLSALAITPTTLPQDTMDVPYDQVISTNDANPVTLAVSNLKNAIHGLTVPSSGTGSLLIDGTPTVAGTETFTVTATDTVTGKTASAKYSIVVNPAVSLTAATLPGDTVGIAYSQAIAASGGTGAVTLVVSNIQNAILGLNVPANGTGSLAIGGTPTVAGTETFTITATDSLGVTGSNSYSVTVNPTLTGLSPAALPADPVYVLPYSQVIAAEGGTNPTLTVSAIQNPIPGLVVPASGTSSITISGTPTAPGTETFTVTATDSVGPPFATTSTTYTITANATDPNGIVLTSISGNSDIGAASFVDPSGNIVVAGDSQSAPATSINGEIAVARYLPDGSLDTSFNGTGFATTAGPSEGSIFALSAVNDPTSAGNEIVVGGEFEPAKGGIVREFALARYNSDGSLDTTFGTNGEVVTNIGAGGSRINGLVVLPNGDIVAAGYAADSSGNGDFALACYTPAGKLGTTFKPAAGDPVGFTTPKGIVTTTFGGTGQLIYSVALQTVLNPVTNVGTTYILASGVATINGNQSEILARYNLDGTLDTTFGTNGWLSAPVVGQGSAPMVVDAAGNTYVAGDTPGGVLTIAKYSPNGTLDTTFTNNVLAANVAGGIGDLAIQQANGTTMIVDTGAVAPAALGYPSLSDHAVVRFDSTAGTLDTSFGNEGYAVPPSFAPISVEMNSLLGVEGSVDIESSGGIVLAGTVSFSGRNFFAVGQFWSSGILNTSFGDPAADAQSDSSSAGLSNAAMATAALLPSAPTSALSGVTEGSPASVAGADNLSQLLVGPQPLAATGAQKAAARHLVPWKVDRVLADLPALDLRTALLAEDVAS